MFQIGPERDRGPFRFSQGGFEPLAFDDLDSRRGFDRPVDAGQGLMKVDTDVHGSWKAFQCSLDVGHATGTMHAVDLKFESIG